MVVVFISYNYREVSATIPMYPDAILVPDPRIKDKVVRKPIVTFCPMDIRVKMTTEKANTNIAQMEYSALKKASAPVNIASYVSYYNKYSLKA